MEDLGNPWGIGFESLEEGSIRVQQAISNVRTIIDDAKGPADITQIALDALIDVARTPPPLSLDDIREAGGAETFIYGRLLIAAAKMKKDPKIVTRINDAFGKHFLLDNVLSEARKLAREESEKKT